MGEKADVGGEKDAQSMKTSGVPLIRHCSQCSPSIESQDDDNALVDLVG